MTALHCTALHCTILSVEQTDVAGDHRSGTNLQDPLADYTLDAEVRQWLATHPGLEIASIWVNPEALAPHGFVLSF